MDYTLHSIGASTETEWSYRHFMRGEDHKEEDLAAVSLRDHAFLHSF